VDKRKSLIVAGIAALAIICIGTGVVLASGGEDEQPLTGSNYDQATQAALDHVGGGTVIETEAGDNGSAYEVGIRKDDGSVVEVSLDENFNVVGSADDDEGSGETEDGGDEDEGAGDDD
jgi:hypothetical protein